MPAQTAEQQEQHEKLKKEVKSVFQLVELQTKDRRGQCDEREIPTIVRSLGLNPTQEQLRDIITELRGEDSEESMSGYVEYERFEKADYRRDNEEKLMRAFRAFDPEGKGYIDGDYLKNLLMTRGDSFRPKEAQEMLVAAAVDEATGHIYYEDFAALLANDGRES